MISEVIHTKCEGSDIAEEKTPMISPSETPRKAFFMYISSFFKQINEFIGKSK